ncbi:MAG: NADH-quinone oxidoreductase subunit NuoE [Bacillota bacterium]|nr:MAG: NADH-quinone oxidoreductase subunit NuoE [Bacillota bacterium]
MALEARVREVVVSGPSGPGALIPLLQLVQEKVGHLPRVSLSLISEKLGLPESRIYGVATFYAQFHMKPRGKYVVRVCQGTACHVRGGKTILEAVEEQLGVKPGDTTPDLLFTLERVACLGACGLAPTMIINDDTYGRLTPVKAQKILASLAEGGTGTTAAS